MKVAILSRNFSRVGGGAESYAVHLAQAMQEDCDITVIAQAFDETGSGLRHLPVPRLPIPSRWINQLWFSWYTGRITRGHFDIVHSHENVGHGQVQTVHVKTVHASLRDKGFPPLRVLLSPRLLAYLWLERRRLRRLPSGNVFVSSLLMHETLAAMDGLAPGTVIPPGVTWPDEPPSPQRRRQARSDLGLAPEGLVVGFVGHDFRKKGLSTLLRAVALLPAEVTLLVVGQPAQASAFQDLTEGLGAGRQCRFLGVVRDMAAVYAAIDVLAHPTTQDVFPMVLLEAMALGTPVVTTGAPYNTMASLLQDGQDALLLPDPSDHRRLADLLERLARDPDLHQRLADGGRRFARRYSWRDVKDAYYAVYRQVLERMKR